jgi:hypothetical protein
MLPMKKLLFLTLLFLACSKEKEQPTTTESPFITTRKPPIVVRERPVTLATPLVGVKESPKPFTLMSGTYTITKSTNTWSMTSGSTTTIDYVKDFDLVVKKDYTVYFDKSTYKLSDIYNDDSTFIFKNLSSGKFQDQVTFQPYSAIITAYRQDTPGKAFGSSVSFKGFKIK